MPIDTHATFPSMPKMESVLRTRDAFDHNICPRSRFPVLPVADALLQTGYREYRSDNLGEITHSIPRPASFDKAVLLAIPPEDGPFSVHCCGYPDSEADTIEEALRLALRGCAGAWEFCEIYNVRHEPVASYFYPKYRYWVQIVDNYHEDEHKNVDWFVHQRLAMASLEGDLEYFETEKEAYASISKLLLSDGVRRWRSFRAAIVTKIDLAKDGRLKSYPKPIVAVTASGENVWELHDEVPASFKKKHPVNRWDQD